METTEANRYRKFSIKDIVGISIILQNFIICIQIMAGHIFYQEYSCMAAPHCRGAAILKLFAFNNYCAVNEKLVNFQSCVLPAFALDVLCK